MKWTKTFLPRRHNAPSPACPFCWAGSFSFDGVLQDVRIAAKKSNRFCGGRIGRGKRDEGAPDAALSGPLRVFCCVEFAGSRGKLLFCHAGKKGRRGARDGAESPRALAGCIARQSPRPFATCCRTAGSKGGRSTHRLQALASLFSKRLYVKSIPNAPSGAVNKMARTATDSTMGPQGSPIARGTEPMAAWTVAFGR